MTFEGLSPVKTQVDSEEGNFFREEGPIFVPLAGNCKFRNLETNSILDYPTIPICLILESFSLDHLSEPPNSSSNELSV